MSALSIQPTYPIFTDIDGQPLEDGYVWIGTANLDPQTNPINVYWDAALTLLAAQPIRTLAGYPANSGTPARLYVNSDYSIRVMNKNGSAVYSAPTATERYSEVVFGGNAEQVVYDPPFANAVQTNVEAKLAQTISVKDFGAVGDGVTDDYNAIADALAALNSAGGGSLYFPQGTYLIVQPDPDSGVPITGNNITIFGDGSASTLYVVGNYKVLSVSNADNFRFTNMRVLQTQAGVNRQTMIGLTGCSNVWITDNLFENGTATPVVLTQDNTDVFICNNRFLNYLENAVDIIGSNNARVTISENFCTTNVYNTNPGVSRPIGITFEPQTSGVNSDFLITGNTIDLTGLTNSAIRNATYGINCGAHSVPAADYLLKRITISDNIIRGVGWGIHLSETRRGTTTGGLSAIISDNLLEQCGHEGIYVNGGPNNTHYDGVVISGNLIRGVSEQATNLDDGIQLEAYLQGPVIVNNKIERRVGESGAANYRYGIYLGANVTNALIDGNIITDATSGRIQDDSGTASIGRTGKSQAFYTSVATITGDEGLTPETGTVLVRTPSGATRSIIPSVTAANLFPKGHTVFIINAATSNFNLVFDPSGINVTISRQSSAAFTFNGTAWVQLRYSASSIQQADTAANIAAAAAAVNTADKYIGKLVWDTTNNRLMRAAGAAAVDPWWVVDGSASVTPV